ncbi:MAG: alpha/beta fold hydrolase [Candidatus Hydrogenedentota bacterium]
MRVVLISVALLLFVATAARAEEQFFDSDGVKIRYWIEGEGEPVLLIHGYTANGNLNWRAPGIQQALAEKYRVIMPDVRGHGLSDAPPEGQHGIHVVEDMVRLLDR